MNDPVIFLAKEKELHPRIRGTNLVTRYLLLEGSCVIPNKVIYMDDKTWENVVKLGALGIRKMKVSNAAGVFLFHSFFI